MATTSQVRRWFATALEHGPTATIIAAAAKRKGAKQKIREFAGLVKLVRSRKPNVVLEIGSLKGGSLWTWCRIASKNATLISVDLPGGDFGGGYQDTETPTLRGYAKRGQTVHLIRGDSHHPDTLEEVRRLLGERAADFLFIDGDHTYEGVLADYEMYGPLVSESGMVAFHDILPHPNSDCEVDRLWTEIRGKARTVELTDTGDVATRGAWGGIGVLLR